MISMQIMKIIGFYQVLRGPKVHGVDIVKCIIKICITMYLIFTLIMIILCLYYCSVHNINESVHYLICLASVVLLIYKMYFFNVNIHRIRDYVNSTSIDHFVYRHHRALLLDEGRTKSNSYSIFFISIWVTSIGIWFLSPLLVDNYYIHVKVGDEIHHYRFNAINFIFPVTDRFYNGHFGTYYIVEISPMICGVFCSMVFDVFVISFCVTIRYQLRTIADSYSTLFDAQNDSISNKMF